ncbi:MAG TPA: sodium:calcium antiporter [Acidobacteriota bacterium]|nr:sodium:calcium antiporter [Acidobacteriota bacterium]
MVMAWIEFAVCLLLIGLAGSRLSLYGDVIAEKTGLSGTWIGILMLATVTSLPELVTALSAVTLAQAPDIAVGGIFGSCVFNLAIIVLIDFVLRPDSVYERTNNGLIVSACYSLVIIGVGAFSLVLAGYGEPPHLLHVSLSTPLIVAIYLLAMRNIFTFERSRQAEMTVEADFDYLHVSLPKAVFGYTAASLVVVGVGIWLPFVGEDLGAAMGWQSTFIGSLFIALATSLPEMVVTLAAARLGAIDMAVGNLFGSNLFNILVLAVADSAFLPGPLLAAASPLHLISALSSMIMTGLAVVGIYQGTRHRPFRIVGWVSVFLALAYILNTYLIFVLDR